MRQRYVRSVSNSVEWVTFLYFFLAVGLWSHKNPDELLCVRSPHQFVARSEKNIYDILWQQRERGQWAGKIYLYFRILDVFLYSLLRTNRSFYFRAYFIFLYTPLTVPDEKNAIINSVEELFFKRIGLISDRSFCMCVCVHACTVCTCLVHACIEPFVAHFETLLQIWGKSRVVGLHTPWCMLIMVSTE